MHALAPRTMQVEITAPDSDPEFAGFLSDMEKLPTVTRLQMEASIFTTLAAQASRKAAELRHG